VSGQLHEPAAFTPRERPLGTHWVYPRSGLGYMEKKNPLPYRDSTSDPLVVQPVGSRYIDYAIPAPQQNSSNSKNQNYYNNISNNNNNIINILDVEIKETVYIVACRPVTT
jgi:hypothetical protein